MVELARNARFLQNMTKCKKKIKRMHHIIAWIQGEDQVIHHALLKADRVSKESMVAQ